jgi:tyrosinase
MTETHSKLNLNTSRYDDFTYAHIHTVNETHGVALSMPWHRYFIWVWEQTLREECGYRGYLPLVVFSERQKLGSLTMV